ncbi:hypothetical protein Gpo141_00013667 [Globisporangium polare]
MDTLLKHRSDAQRAISKFKDRHGKIKCWRYRATRSRRFYEGMLSLNHFRIRQVLQAKSEVSGTRVVDCSEMSTSRTYTQCDRLHLQLEYKDVIDYPHCACTSSRRDENAAFSMLRYVLRDPCISMHRKRGFVPSSSDGNTCTAT